MFGTECLTEFNQMFRISGVYAVAVQIFIWSFSAFHQKWAIATEQMCIYYIYVGGMVISAAIDMFSMWLL